MSDSYQTIIWKGTEDNSVLPDCPVSAFLTPVLDGTTAVVFPEVSPTTPDIADYLAAQLSLTGITLLADVRDGDSTLRLRLFEGGQPLDQYIAEPGYLTGDILPPQGGDAIRWCHTFGIEDEYTVADLKNILRATRYDEDFGYLVASERHREIVELLGLSTASVGFGYREISRGHAPEGIASVLDLKQVTAATEPKQYILLAPPADATEEEIASYLYPEVIALELGIEKDEWRSQLGTAPEVQEMIQSAFGIDATSPLSHWLRLPGDSIDIDLGTSEETVLETATIFVSVPGGDNLDDALRKIADATDGTIWDVAARRVMVNG